MKRALTATLLGSLLIGGVVALAGGVPCDPSEAGCVFEDDGQTFRTDADGAAWPACQAEDGTNCWWDATTRGNGEGRSFLVDDAGQVTYLP